MFVLISKQNINKLCEQNVEYLNVTAGGKYFNHQFPRNSFSSFERTPILLHNLTMTSKRVT
jgi:hypothetical protein